MPASLTHLCLSSQIIKRTTYTKFKLLYFFPINFKNMFEKKLSVYIEKKNIA